MALIWALLIGSALGYILTSMADEAFNFTQSIGFSIAAFIAIIFIDAVLSAADKQTN